MPRTKTDNILNGILILMIIIVAGMIYTIVTTPKLGERFTEFYILNDRGDAGEYLTELELNNSSTYLVGVISHEYVPVRYTIDIVLENDILKSESVTLKHNEIWEKGLTFVPNKEGTDMKLAFLLFKEDNFEEPYRELYLWVNSTL